jgi:hypothetical protein
VSEGRLMLILLPLRISGAVGAGSGSLCTVPIGHQTVTREISLCQRLDFIV